MMSWFLMENAIDQLMQLFYRSFLFVVICLVVVFLCCIYENFILFMILRCIWKIRVSSPSTISLSNCNVALFGALNSVVCSAKDDQIIINFASFTIYRLGLVCSSYQKWKWDETFSNVICHRLIFQKWLLFFFIYKKTRVQENLITKQVFINHKDIKDYQICWKENWYLFIQIKDQKLLFFANYSFYLTHNIFYFHT